MDLEIKQITPEETFEIREKVLEKYQTMKEFEYDGDYERNSFHLGAFHEDDLISVGSFYHEKYPHFEEENQYRLRGMATLEEYQGKGAGTEILNYGEKLLKRRYARLLWCLASMPVSDYYTKFGLQEHGKIFVVESIGPHKVMYKIL